MGWRMIYVQLKKGNKFPFYGDSAPFLEDMRSDYDP